MFGGIPDFRAELVRSADDGHTCWTEWHWSGNRTDGPGSVVRLWLPPAPAADYGLRASAEPESIQTP